VGTKTGWFDNRLTVDAAVFTSDWKDITKKYSVGAAVSNTVPNAGRRDQQGRGTRGSLAPKWNPLELSAAFGYQDAKIAKAARFPATAGRPGFQVPDWTANASGTWNGLCGPVGSSSAR